MTLERVAIAMSGGVDSSTAAAILKEAGYDLVGFSMRLWGRDRGSAEGESLQAGRCCSMQDLSDAGAVAARLKIPCYVVDFREEFERTVVKPFIESYRAGLTPSPCVRCNALMKFDHLVRIAEEVRATRIATGHYARVSLDPGTGRHLLRQAHDQKKDQSYFLFELNQVQLAKALFPLGDLKKEQVRRIARCLGLPVAEKAESQEICFIPDGDYAACVERRFETAAGAPGRRAFSPGNIVDRQGRILGVHPGIHNYTIGQRRGLGVAHASALYVLEIRPEDNTVVVGSRDQLGKCRCRVVRPNWISIPNLCGSLRVQAKIRSRHPAAPATIAPDPGGGVDVLFDVPQPAVTPGQACVFYQEETVVGGGWIDRFPASNGEG